MFYPKRLKHSKRYKTGLEKIQETNVVIDEMQQTLTELEPELKAKSEATEKVILNLKFRHTKKNEVQTKYSFCRTN